MTRMSSALPDTSFSSANGARICIQGKGVWVTETLLALLRCHLPCLRMAFPLHPKPALAHKPASAYEKGRLSQADDVATFIDKDIVCIA